MPTHPRTIRQKPRNSGRSIKARKDARRYGRPWRRIRDAQLAREPVCNCDRVRAWDARSASVIVFAAGESGERHPAVLVDHVRPLEADGTDDPDNLQSLCARCHAVKTRRFG